jgi:hypothetical protein
MILSDERIYNCIKQRANSFGYVRSSRAEIMAKTGYCHMTIERSLLRLMKSERLWWERPPKERPDKYKTAFYTVDPTISRLDYRRLHSPQPGSFNVIEKKERNK